jgi:hypothetical protein
MLLIGFIIVASALSLFDRLFCGGFDLAVSEMLHYLPSEHPLREKFSLKKEKNENIPPIKLPAREELKVGGIGWEVMELQRILKKQGCYGGPIDGEFGLRTLNSVKLFQGQKDLIQSGVVDQALWKLLYEV